MPRRKKATEPQLPLAPPARELRVLSVQVRNVLGLEERNLEADGRAVLVSGPNASGKSSLLQAVQAGLGGGSLAKLARVGAEDEPEVVLVLGGNGDEYRVEKRGDETARVLKRVGDSQAFADVTRPQQFLNGLLDTRLSNPVAWLLAKPKDQAILLLEALPLDMNEDALRELLADVKGHLHPVPAGLHPLEHLAMLRDHLFSARTGVNRDARSKTEAAEQLRRELPAKLPADPATEISEAEARAGELADALAREEEQAEAAEREAIASAQAETDREVDRIRQAFKAKAETSRAAMAKRAAELRAQVERQITEETAVVEKDIENARSEAEARIAEQDRILRETREAAKAARATAEEALQARRSELSEARVGLMGLRGQAEQAASFQALDRQAGGFEAEAERHKVESKRLTAAMERLDGFRRDLAKDLPIPGLEIEGSDIRLDGVPLHQVNAARRVEVAARVATARAERNPLKVLFLDGLEGLDSEHREALLSYLVEHGVQAFGAVVTDGEPNVTYVGAVSEEGVGASA